MLNTLSPQAQQIRLAAEADLLTFIRLNNPEAVLGSVHEELISFISSPDRRSHILVLMPRDHQKSRIAAFAVAWMITKRPDIRILYISSTANLAEKQLGFIKSILTSRIYRRYWPEMVNEEESKREKWTNSEISIDHPKRKVEKIRDPTVFTAGLTTSITGMHCDISIFDDVVVYENAYTIEGRNRVASQVSLLASIEGTDAKQLVFGTRYHPEDAYGKMLAMEYTTYDENGEELSTDFVYDSFTRKVEEEGEFLWPRQQRMDGRWFGFDANILSKKKAQYLDKTQFYAQYYNDPNNPEAQMNRDKFQYYDKKHLTFKGGYWWYNEERLNTFAAMDLAYSQTNKADWTSIVVIGIDSKGRIYVLEICRFKTDSIKMYYDNLIRLYLKWGFRKVKAEITAAQKVIVRDIKNNYIRPNGYMLSIDEFSPSRHIGSKDERIKAILQPRYDDQIIWHGRGGLFEVLEDELILENPPHDDIKDALACAIDLAIPPKGNFGSRVEEGLITHSRFGGIAL